MYHKLHTINFGGGVKVLGYKEGTDILQERERGLGAVWTELFPLALR